MQVYDLVSMLLHNYDRLEENGQTALGPALVISILLAARSSGSQVSYNTLYTGSVVHSASVLYNIMFR